MILEIVEHRWIGDPADAAGDYCSHGFVRFEVDGQRFIDPSEALLCTSAAGLFLLRTLLSSHVPDGAGVAPGNQLFPCCGQDPYAQDSGFGVDIVGCPNGIDIAVVHHEGAIQIGPGTDAPVVSMTTWRQAVLSFASSVESFYATSTPKRAPEAWLRTGWQAFWSEWNERRNGARAVLRSDSIAPGIEVPGEA